MPVILRLSYFRYIFKPHLRFHSKSSKTNLVNVLKTMPKEPKHIADAQKQRKKIKERISKYVPGKVTLQVLGSGARGAPRALYMFSDQSRYLFNCGEGTQRLAHEHKMKLARLEHIFITQPVWKNIGGLPGTALTVQDVGVPEITLHGPPGLDEIFTATKRFVIIRDLKIHMADCKEDVTFEDNVMTVKYVALLRNKNEVVEEEPEGGNHFKDSAIEAVVDQADVSTSTRSTKNRRRRSKSVSDKEEIDNTDYYAHEHNDTGTSPNSVSSNSQELLQEMKEKGVSMAYVCRLQPRPGALDLNKCVKMGVPPGPLLGKLKSGESVTLPDGTTVNSKDVCEPDDPGPVFIVVDCPSVEYLDSLVNNETFKRHQSFATRDEDLAYLVVHFTPKEVVQDPRYKKWIENFSLSTQHLMLNEFNTCMGSEAVYRIQHKLNLLSEDLFPLLGDHGTEIVLEEPDISLRKKLKLDDGPDQSEVQSSLKNFLDLEKLAVKSDQYKKNNLKTESYIFPNTFCNFHLRPRSGLDRNSELKLHPLEYINETLALDNFPDALAELKNKLIKLRKDSIIREYPQVVFMGTGSCIPNKTRNTSGILLKTDENQHILLDCGEGTYGQLVRFFGQEESNKVLADINAVYISHLHADHHIGLIGFLQGRRRALSNLKLEKPPLYLFAPKQILAWLSFYNRCFESINKEFQLVPNSDLILDNKNTEFCKVEILDYLGLSNISTCYVRHCPNAFGVAISSKDGSKITYSGDTMPSENLVELGYESDILIHEATMEDELSHEAIVKMHSTTSQAIEVGKKMKAKNILLTHFSQRYARLPRFNDNFTENIGIAFDNMRIKMDELPFVPNLYPALRLMFAEHYEELEHKAVKRQLKIDRQKSLNKS